MWKERAQGAGKEFDKVALWDVECLARVRNVIHTPLAFRRVPFRSRFAFCCDAMRRSFAATANHPLTNPGPPFPPTCESAGAGLFG